MEIVEKSEQDKNKNNTTATKNMGFRIRPRFLFYEFYLL